MTSNLKIAGAVLLCFISGGLVGFALEQRLAPKPAMIDHVISLPAPAEPVTAPKRKPTAHTHKHHVPHRSAEDDTADQLNQRQPDYH